MIKSITLSNFFSFAEQQTVELDPYVNILIGINGSGKSNFIKAIELLSRGIEDGGAQGVIDEWAGLHNVKNHKFHNDKTPVKLSYIFDGVKVLGDSNGNANSTLEYHLILLDKDEEGRTSSTNQLVYLNDKEIGEVDDHSFSAKRNLLPSALTFKDKTIERLRNAIEGITVYDELDVSEIRVKNSKHDKNNNRVTRSTQNLPSTLYYLSVYYPDYEEIKKLLKKVNPHFKEVSFISRGIDEIEITMEEGGLPLEIAIQHISTGTLKFLTLLAILYNPNRGKLVCLEEPERGLHPDMIKTVASGIKHAARTGTQMIVSTHSPFLLDFFLIDEILVFEKDKNNETQVIRKTEDDYEGWLDEYTAGDLWMSGKMGGTR